MGNNGYTNASKNALIFEQAGLEMHVPPGAPFGALPSPYLTGLLARGIIKPLPVEAPASAGDTVQTVEPLSNTAGPAPVEPANAAVPVPASTKPKKGQNTPLQAT